MDMISQLPPNIIETILCFLPIQDAARTSILSKEWRYHWTKIPKLVFNEDTFQVSTHDAEVSVMDSTCDQSNPNEHMTKSCKLIDAICHVLLVHEGPIHELTLSFSECSWIQIDHIMFTLSQQEAIKNLNLEFSSGYVLQLHIFSLYQLTDLHLTGCDLEYELMDEEFSNLASLYIQEVTVSRSSLISLLWDCPSLKSASLNIDNLDSDQDLFTCYDSSQVGHLFERLPTIENLSIGFGLIECFAQDGIPQELPITLVHLKYLCLKDICFIHKHGLPIIALLIKSSPNLEKLKLEILDDSWVDILDRRDFFTVEDESNVWLEHLNELEITNMIYRNVELDFVKRILAKAPLLKKVRISLFNEVAKDEALHVSEILKQTPHASPVVQVIVEVIEGSCPSSRSVM